uniref:SS18 like 2 n=1 Tax=Sus scrofa TaxID=9823 RepID=A0A8D0W4J7_PIG
MSVAFVPDSLRGKAEVNQETIQRLLEENDQLIRCIVEYQNKGRANECVHPCSQVLNPLRHSRNCSQRFLTCLRPYGQYIVNPGVSFGFLFKT